jgi:hypothetical protein
MICKDIPIQEFNVQGRRVYVARDDLCAPFPGNNNSKMRGVHRLLKGLDAEAVGVWDTEVSRSGWGVAWLASSLKKRVYVYARPEASTNFFALMAHLHGAKIVTIPASMDSIGWYMARRDIERRGGVMLPLYLRLKETVEEVEEAASKVLSKYDVKTIVVSVGRGTIASGLIRAADEGVSIIGVTHFDFPPNGLAYINEMSGRPNSIRIYPLSYTYGEANLNAPPFPCDLYYDRWAWEWLTLNVDQLKEPILFWNIGGEWHHVTGLYPSFRGDGLVTKELVERWIELRREGFAYEG